MNQYFVLAANQAGARLWFRKQKFSDMESVASFSHEEGRLHEGDLIANDPGYTSPSAGSGMDAMNPDNSAKETEARRFADELAGNISQRLHNHDDTGLVLIAAPKFLGRLREKLDGPVSDKIMLTIDKNLDLSNESDIKDHIDSQLRGDG